jgi:hypothetical protein
MSLHVVYLINNLRGGPIGISKLHTERKGHLYNHQETIIVLRAVPQLDNCKSVWNLGST